MVNPSGCLDATAIDELDGSFDAVFSAFVLHFLAGRVQALAEVARVLRPGGTFEMSVPGPGSENRVGRDLRRDHR
jgi:ubiquinone/menaquinone biosynthesis C-methylase UbiE